MLKIQLAMDPKALELLMHYIQHNVHNVRTQPRDYHSNWVPSMAATIERCPGYTEVCTKCKQFEKLKMFVPPQYVKIPCTDVKCVERREKEERISNMTKEEKRANKIPFYDSDDDDL